MSREPAGERANDGVGQGLRLAIGLRGAVCHAILEIQVIALMECVNGLHTSMYMGCRLSKAYVCQC